MTHVSSRRRAIAPWWLAWLFLANVAVAAPAAEPDDAARAREAYNAGRYADAARSFLLAVQASPTDAPLYRDLARARLYANDPVGAVIAYRYYVELAPSAEDTPKVEAELALAVRRARPVPPIGPPVAAARKAAESRERARKGRFVGNDGAFASLDAAMAAGLLGPSVVEERAFIPTELVRQAGLAVDRFWQPGARAETSALEGLAAGFALLASRRAPTGPEQALDAAMRGLGALSRGENDAALVSLATVAPADPRLRFAQSVALIRAGRFEEAAQALAAIDGPDADPRIPLLLGLAKAKSGQDGAPHLRRALGLQDGD